MYDVNRSWCFLDETHHGLDCPMLCLDRTTGEIVGIFARRSAMNNETRRILRVNHQRQSRLSEKRKRFAQVSFGHIFEFVDTGRSQKALERSHSCSGERENLVGISRHYSADELYVHKSSVPRCFPFFFQSLDIRRRRNRIERHVENRGNSTCSSSPGCRFETFPLGASGIVDVYVRVDDSRHHDAVSCIVVGLDIIGRNSLDAFLSDVNGRDSRSLGRDHTPAANYSQAVSAQNRRRRFIDTRRR